MHFWIAYAFFTGINIQSFPLDAECSVKGRKGIHGDIVITQESRHGPLSIDISLDGFEMSNASRQHGIQIHENPFDAGDCRFVGSLFNPSKEEGMSPKNSRRLSNIGTLLVLNGSSRMNVVVKDLFLFGQNGIAGRTIAIHEDLNDLGLEGFERKAGSYKEPVACCRILFVTAQLGDTVSSPHLYGNIFFISIYCIHLLKIAIKVFNVYL